MLNHRRKFAAFFLVFFLVSYSSQAYAFLPLAFAALRGGIARFVPSKAVISVTSSGAKQLEILSSRFVAKYPQGRGSSVLVLRRISSGVTGSFLASFLVSYGYSLFSDNSTGSNQCTITGGASHPNVNYPSFGAARTQQNEAWALLGYSLKNDYTKPGYSDAYTAGYYNPDLKLLQHSSIVCSKPVVFTPPVDAFGAMIVDIEGLPSQAAKDAKAADIVSKLKTYTASNPNIPFDDGVALLEGGALNGIGYSVDANGKGHFYKSDTSGNISVDGVPVVESKSPDFVNGGSYTDSNGVSHALSYDGDGNLLDNGKIIVFGSSTGGVTSQTVDSATGNTTSTVRTQNAGGSVVSSQTVTNSTGSVVSTSQTGSSTVNSGGSSLANGQASQISGALSKKLDFFKGDSGASTPTIVLHVDGKAAYVSDMKGEFDSLGVSSMIKAIMGTFGMLISIIMVVRAVLS